MSSNNPSIQAKSGRYVVASTFRSVNDFSRVHSEGEDVSTFDAERLTDLVKRGLVKFIPEDVKAVESVEDSASNPNEGQQSDQPEEKSKRGKKPRE